jgi:prefoldin subunit 5
MPVETSSPCAQLVPNSKNIRAIETTLQIQENNIAGQDSEMAGLHAKITELNEHIVTISMASSGHHGNKTKKSVIADPDIFKADKLDNKNKSRAVPNFLGSSGAQDDGAR